MHLNYPSSQGLTQSLEITTFKDYTSSLSPGTIIDQNIADVTYTMLALTSAISNKATLSDTTASGIGTLNIEFNFRAGNVVDPSSIIEF